MMTLTVAKKRRHSRRWMERATLFLTTCCLFVGSAFSYTTTTLSVDPAYPDATLHIPAGYVGAPTQLVLMLHGYDSDGAGHESYFQFLSLIDSRGFLYAHPDGRLNTYSSRYWDANDSCCVVDGNVGGDEDSIYLKSLIEEIQDLHNIDKHRIHVIGHSNGGMMAYRMACDHAGTIASVASLAGPGYYDETLCEPSEAVHALHIHGTIDGTIAYAGGTIPASFGLGTLPYPGAVTTTTDWSDRNHCLIDEDNTREDDLDLIFGPQTDTEITRYASGCDFTGSAELWTIPGENHVPSIKHPNFETAILDFFDSHPKHRIGFADKDTLTWPAIAGSEQYNVYRGFVSGLPGANYGNCVSQSDPDDTDLVFEDLEVPDPTDGFTYLTTYLDDFSRPAEENSVGYTSAGVQRISPPECP